jgi:hypothetical protein
MCSIGWLAGTILVTSHNCAQNRPYPEWRGLLASPGLEGQPVKGAYFFPGETRDLGVYTAHPLILSDQRWNSDPSSRATVMARMTAAHVNTVVMSFWSDMTQWSPMAIDSTTLSAVLQAIEGKPLVIMPAIEVGYDPQNRRLPQWEFANEFPGSGNGPIAPGLVARIGQLVNLFAGHMNLWACLYDRAGNPRYALNLLHVFSAAPNVTDEQFAEAFDQVALEVWQRFHIRVGFTLDTVGGPTVDNIPVAYAAYPKSAGRSLERRTSVLAVQGFVSEVFSGKLKMAPPWPHDNNLDDLPQLADWKRAAVSDWIATALPVILDVSNGYDGRLVFQEHPNAVWGDNLVYTDDRWRNWGSELKGSGINGVTFDAWNGYTEGFVAVPTREHGQTVYNWLTDLLEPDPRNCSHMHYVGGVRTFRVYGAICAKWVQLGADRAFGPPVTNERATPHGRGRVSYFANGKAIYWSVGTDAHEVHGIIEETYQNAGADASCLGLPVTDEQPAGGGRVSRFEHGQIDWKRGDSQGHISCR